MIVIRIITQATHLVQLLPIDRFFPASPGQRCGEKKPFFSSPSRGKKRSSPLWEIAYAGCWPVRNCERKPARSEQEGRGESPAVHLLCRGLLRFRIKSVSGTPPSPSLRLPRLSSLLFSAFSSTYILLHTLWNT